MECTISTTAPSKPPWRRGPNVGSREAKADSATTGLVTARTQVSAEGEGAGCKRGLPTVHPPSLPHHEGRPEPHDRVQGWEIMPMWVKVMYFPNYLLATFTSLMLTLWDTRFQSLATSKLAVGNYNQFRVYEPREGACWGWKDTPSKSIVVFSLLVARPLQSAVHVFLFPLSLLPPLSPSRSPLCLLTSDHISLEELSEIWMSCLHATEALFCGPAISGNRSVFWFNNLVSLTEFTSLPRNLFTLMMSLMGVVALPLEVMSELSLKLQSHDEY